MRKFVTSAVLVIALLFALASCNVEYDKPEIYEITSERETYTVEIGEVIDFKTLFTLTETVSGRRLDITDDMISAPNADFTKEGMFTVTCSFGAALKSVIVVVEKGEYNGDPADVKISGIDVTVAEGAGVNVKNLFTVKVNGEKVSVTDNMLDLGGLDTENALAGVYTVTLTYTSFDGVTHTGTLTVTVNAKTVEPDPTPVNVVISANNKTVEEGTAVDLKTLFTVKADGVNITVTDSMISPKTNISSAGAGTYTFTLTYTSTDGVTHTKTATVTVNAKTVEPDPTPVNVVINATNKTVEEGTAVDLKTLFTVKADGVNITVTDSMISPKTNISSASAGTYTFTLTYTSTDGVTHTKTATVTVNAKVVEPEPTPTPEHAGTKADPYTVSDAITVLDGLVVDSDGYAVTELVYVKGVVVSRGTVSSNGNYFKNVVISDTAGGSVTLKIYSANPTTESDKNFAVGDTILLKGYLRITSNTGKEMGSKGSEYTYFSVVGGSGGGTTAEKMPTQVYNPSNHTANEQILTNATEDYIKNDPDNGCTLAIGLPSQGTYNALVVPVQFKNDTFTSQELLDLQIAFNGTSVNTGWESVNTYYQKASYGKLNITFDIYDACITMPSNYSAYESGTGSQDILAYVLSALDPTMDLSQYDTNSDGYIDAVYLIYSAPVDYEDANSNYWAFVNWEFESDSFDGVYAHTYLFAGVDFMYEELGSDENGYPGLLINSATYIHETGHLLGLDDYYDYNEGEGSDEGLGNADMMDATVGDHNAYSKLLLGWVTPTVITSSQTVTLESFAESGQFIMILLDYNGTYFSEYLIIDLYTATGVNKLHASVEGSYLYDGEQYGARIYHVSSNIETPFNDDYFSFTSNNNSKTATPLIKLIEADGDENYESDIYDGYRYASYDDLWQSGDSLGVNQSGFTRHDGKLVNFDIVFDSVSASGATVTITFD